MSRIGQRAPTPTASPTMMTEQTSPASRNAPHAHHPTHEEIARRAYELFLARGGMHGHHEDDWAQAERELRLGR